MPEEILDKKGVIKAIIIAALVALVGIIVLGWQYHQIERKRLPAIEKALEEQKEVIEEKTAQDVLRDFMIARISQNKALVNFHITERAEEQARLEEFVLIANFSSYEIMSSEKLDEDEYRFIVKMYYEDIPVELTEIITLIKIPAPENKYFIDSVQIAG